MNMIKIICSVPDRKGDPPMKNAGSHSRITRLLSAVLAAALLLALCGNALADTVTLPRSTVEIAEEAFASDDSLDTVDIPYGAKSIGSRAFADSGVKKIYIPDTVETIADDAFEGTAVTVCAGIASYAKQWADAHDVPWEDCLSHYGNDAESVLMELAEGTLYIPEALEINDSYISVSGVTNPQTLAAIREYNALIDRKRAQAEAYNASLDTLNGAIGGMAGWTSDFQGSSTDSTVTYAFGDYCVVIDRNLTGLFNGNEIAGVAVSEEGDYVEYTAVNGTKLYLSQSGNTTCVSKQPNRSSSASLLSRSTASYLQYFMEQLRSLESLVNACSSAFSAMVRESEALVEILTAQKELAKQMNNDELYVQAGRELTNAKLALGAIRALQVAFQAVNFGYAIANGFRIADHWQKLIDISNHAHPTHNDNSLARRNMCTQMKLRIDQLRSFYVLDATVTIVQGVVSLTTLLVNLLNLEAGGVLSLGAFGSIIASLAMWGISTSLVAWENRRFSLAVEIDNRLHSFVSGVVKDKDTQKPLRGVKVASETEYTYTDEAGRYFIAVDPAVSTLLRFSLDEYTTAGTFIQAPEWQEITKNMELEKDDGTYIYGIVYSRNDFLPIAGAIVKAGSLQTTTAVDGTYEIEIEDPGTYIVSVVKEGYTAEPQTVVVQDRQHCNADFEMRKCHIIRTREDLEAVAEAPDEDYALGNSIDLSDAPWTPNTAFSGTLDGAGYSITGMNIFGGEYGANIGLFTALEDARISGLVLYAAIDVPISSNSTRIGALAGAAEGDTHITDCVVFANITGSGSSGDAHIGGIVGYANSCHMKDCFVMADITLRYNQTACVGGLCGNMDGDSTAVNADAEVNINVKQNGSNSAAAFYVRGTSWFNNNTAEYCDCSGVIRVETNDAEAQAFGCAVTRQGNNSADITVTSQSGDVQAAGLMLAQGGVNTGNISASSQTGWQATAAGAYCTGSDTRSEGSVHAETSSGEAWAYGVFDSTEDHLCFDCENSGEVTAVAVSGRAYAIALTGCVKSLNSGAVSASAASGDAYANGLENSSYSENTANINASVNGNSRSAAHGLLDCIACVNRGSIKAQNTGSGSSYATGAQEGNYNENHGGVEAYSAGGEACANGTLCDNSQNYGNILARGHSAFSTGCGDHKACLNEGPVSSYADGDSSSAYGVNGAGSVSTGLVFATQLATVNQSNYSHFCSILLTAMHSTQCRVTVNGRSVFASGGRKTGFSYNYMTGAISTWDAITNWDYWVGLCVADSVEYGYDYAWPVVPDPPVRQ